jgi:Na+-driven multidrug efflux pump
MAFDRIYTWVLVVPYTYALVAYTNWGIETLYPLSQLTNVLKAVLGLIVVSAGFWARNLVSDQQVPVVEQ